MNEEKIFKLLQSPHEGDVLIGLSLLAKLEDPRRFMRTYGRAIHGQTDEECGAYGKRFEIKRWDRSGSTDNYYYKINDSLYILFGVHYDICECYRPYNEETPIINI